VCFYDWLGCDLGNHEHQVNQENHSLKKKRHHEHHGNQENHSLKSGLKNYVVVLCTVIFVIGVITMIGWYVV